MYYVALVPTMLVHVSEHLQASSAVWTTIRSVCLFPRYASLLHRLYWLPVVTIVLIDLRLSLCLATDTPRCTRAPVTIVCYINVSSLVRLPILRASLLQILCPMLAAEMILVLLLALRTLVCRRLSFSPRPTAGAFEGAHHEPWRR